jgi:hypothetical protein
MSLQEKLDAYQAQARAKRPIERQRVMDGATEVCAAQALRNGR